MDDVQRALERAAESIAEEDGDTPGTPVDRIWARAAVLACLNTLPPTMTVAELAAALRARGEG